MSFSPPNAFAGLELDYNVRCDDVARSSALCCTHLFIRLYQGDLTHYLPFNRGSLSLFRSYYLTYVGVNDMAAKDTSLQNMSEP